MAATIDFHGPKSKYFLAPDFTTIALSDEEPISSALDLVLRAKKKSVLPAERDILVKNISTFAKGDDVGALRALQDHEWKQLDVPLICRIYLKHLIMQSCALTRQQLLECDFNSGLKYNWQEVQDKVTQILALGFSRNEALEAIMVTDNKQVELAAQYLLTDEETRKMEYERAKRQRNQCVPPNRHWTIIDRIKQEKDQKLQWQKKSENELLLEIQKLKGQLNSIRKKRLEFERKRDDIAKSSRLTLYKEYIRGVTAEQSINTAELTHMDRYKQQRKINEEDHQKTLKDLGFTTDSFDKLKSYEDVTTNEDECVVCYEPPKDHMVVPCNHVCLCPECAEENFSPPHDGQKCPLCSNDIQNVKQVFYF
eukprot:CAMPEP_0197026682 /NCGR_PEP_ID=MMETSP1384-20130603/6716_1 /TAXON_ID=29189 /ORGANISM="Ammonia sp." /LENGTH=366 /DNA_ID=CAMNT_0042455387 /DNA_START=21 /DNA_END=1121 /DNA_ORIENTATION=-